MAGQPTHIDRYEIKSRIGRGGMGDLYLALDPSIGRLVALKLLAMLDSTELRERFKREARALAALNHPNIVRIYDTGEFEGSPFIVMEYVRGETLAELIRRRAALSVSQKLKLMEELCAGLAQAHAAGIIHRDIKPANLMVDQQNHLKILDFGIARVAEIGRTRIGVPLTQMNMQIGTPGYMSPEQIEGGEVDRRSDIFAVGAVCYELLAYDEAFSGANTNQIESRVMRGQPRPLASTVPGLDPEIDEIILRALKTDPNQRFQDAATLQGALERYRLRLEPEAEPAPEPADEPARQTPTPTGSRGKSREARAEAAYQRALASYQSGSRDAARRFAVEAIAEDSGHAGARALLSRLERRPSESTAAAAPPRDVPSPPRPAAASESAPTMISGQTMVSGSTLASGSTVISGTPLAPGSARASGSARAPGSARPSGSASAPGSTVVSGSTFVSGSTMASESAVASGATIISQPTMAPRATSVSDETRVSRPAPSSDRRPPAASAPTILVTPPSARKSTPSWKRWFGGGGGAGASSARSKAPARATAGANQPFWIRYGTAAPIAAIVVLVLLIGGGGLLLVSWLRPSGQLLTVTKPTGGSLSGPGIRCGTAGNDCTARRPNDETIELTAQADPGFVFRGYTGDCAPGGLMIMRAPKTCGATFEALPPDATVVTQSLTISPVPTGGTLEGVDILCGTKGSVCSAKHPDGVPVELHPTADAGFTFMGFTGDCAPLGHTQMTGPRTCGATFTPTDSLKPASNLRPGVGGKTIAGPTTAPTPGPTPPPAGNPGASTPATRGGVPPRPAEPPIAVNPPPPVAVPQGGTVPPPPKAEPAAPPISDEDYAKNAVKAVLKDLCSAYEAIDPDAVQQVYPKVNMAALRLQLNKTQYKSVSCMSAEPTFLSVDPAAGTAKVRVEVKRVFEHAALDPKPDVSELIATMTLSRASQRGRWVIDAADYRIKPKEK